MICWKRTLESLGCQNAPPFPELDGVGGGNGGVIWAVVEEVVVLRLSILTELSGLVGLVMW